MVTKTGGSAETVPTKAAAPSLATADIAPATGFAPSGAAEQTVPDVDPSHPAVDSNPRAGTTKAQNAIDFNDPTLPGYEAVARNLKGEG